VSLPGFPSPPGQEEPAMTVICTRPRPAHARPQSRRGKAWNLARALAAVMRHRAGSHR